jgi:hypothetical protein
MHTALSVASGFSMPLSHKAMETPLSWTSCDQGPECHSLCPPQLDHTWILTADMSLTTVLDCTCEHVSA